MIRRPEGRLGGERWRQEHGALRAPKSFCRSSKVPVANVTAPQVLEVMRRIEARGAIETGHRGLQPSTAPRRRHRQTSSNPSRRACATKPHCQSSTLQPVSKARASSVRCFSSSRLRRGKTTMDILAPALLRSTGSTIRFGEIPDHDSRTAVQRAAVATGWAQRRSCSARSAAACAIVSRYPVSIRRSR